MKPLCQVHGPQFLLTLLEEAPVCSSASRKKNYSYLEKKDKKQQFRTKPALPHLFLSSAIYLFPSFFLL
jgi:hypothetical protein